MEEGEAAPRVLEDPQKMLLQYFIAQRVVSKKDLKVKCKEFLNYYKVAADDVDVEEMIGPINKALHFMWLEIRKGVAEATGDVYYGLVNLRNDDHAQMSTDYSITELDFFKRLIKAIVTETEGVGELGTTEALNLVDSVQKMSKKEGEELITALVKDHWLHQGRGYISLGIRTFLELRPYLTEMYEEHLIECVLCHDIVVKGQSCENEKCTTKMHDHCAKRWFGGKGNYKCPTCSAEWPH